MISLKVHFTTVAAECEHVIVAPWLSRVYAALTRNTYSCPRVQTQYTLDSHGTADMYHHT